MKTILCNVHGYTHWESSLLEIINTPEFQRLRRIKQLAAVHHVFPGATHTRFEHSIGVGHLAEGFAKSLLASNPDLPINVFVLKLAGLCHDLGHGPMSHAFDRFLERRGVGSAHEDRSCAILRKLVVAYAIPIERRDVDMACELIAPKTHALPQFWYQIIANDIDGIDVDKLDYLQRDAQHTGMGLSVDIQRFFLYARVINERLCYASERMPFAINQLFMVRHQLHHQVYQHSVVRAIELMYIDVLDILGDVISEEDVFIDLTDFVFDRHYSQLLRQTGQLPSASASKAIEILERIERRDLYTCVYSKQVDSLTAKLAASAFAPTTHTDLVAVDVVAIGYEANPLFKVKFYDKNGASSPLKMESTSSVFCREMQDCCIRMYARASRRSGGVLPDGKLDDDPPLLKGAASLSSPPPAPRLRRVSFSDQTP